MRLWMPSGKSRLDMAIEAAGGEEAFRELWNGIGSEQNKLDLGYKWEWRARPKQLPPPGQWSTWMIRAGRGWGKSLTGAQWVRHRVEKEGARLIALVGATAGDTRKVMVEGPSGILAVCPPDNRPVYEPSNRQLTWPNGALAITYSAEEPSRLRGPEHDTYWADELLHWQFMEEAWDNLQFGMRRGDPRGIVTSSPRGLAFLRALEAESDTVVTIGSMHENTNLPPKFRRRIIDKYDGTRLGRQEIYAEILTDNPNALWTQKRIDELRVEHLPDDLLRVVIGVDPAVTSHNTRKRKSDDTGIVCAALAPCRCRGRAEEHGFIFHDSSDVYKPDIWGAEVIRLYEQHLADLVVAEINNGGELVERNIRTCDGGKNVAYKGIHASRGKRMRHEPVASLTEQGKIHHVGKLSRLEDQMTQWDSTQGESPDRLDAATIAITELMIERKLEESRVGITVYSG